jgi:hypothetical protein
MEGWMKEKQEIHCHECNKYVQFDIDLSLNGNHVLKCPVCGHEHCRVVKDGIITDDRWSSRNRTIYVTQTTYSASSTYATYSAGSTSTGTASSYLYGSWMNTTS